MATTTGESSVAFTKDGAVYRPGNGNTINYKKVGGIFYHVDTPDAVVEVLERARSCRQRVRLYYGDKTIGKDWLEENDVVGYIGNSIGPLKVPLLIYHRRSHGGCALLDQCLVKIRWTTGGVIYQHPMYHTDMFTVREIGPEEAGYDGNLRESGYTHAVDVDGKIHANFRSLKAARHYVRKMIG